MRHVSVKSTSAKPSRKERALAKQFERDLNQWLDMHPPRRVLVAAHYDPDGTLSQTTDSELRALGSDSGLSDVAMT